MQTTIHDIDNLRSATTRAELAARIARIVPEDGTAEPLAGVRLRRASARTELGHGTSFPSFCVIAQGAKEVRLGNRRFVYDPDHFLIASNALPFASRVAEASPECPYLGVVIALDPKVVASVMVEAGQPATRGNTEVAAMDVGTLDADLLEAVLRLVRLVDMPDKVRVLAPLIEREIVFHLLTGDHADRTRQIATLGEGSRIAKAIARLRTGFARPLRIEDLARDLGMSVSSFHHRFKQATAMSPLQFQKQLRLQEARRLMLGEQLDATTAGLRVGYDDAAYFSRDYKRQFGEPPMRDIERLRVDDTPARAAL
jgi:AraC-like DNA-binding protein